LGKAYNFRKTNFFAFYWFLSKGTVSYSIDLLFVFACGKLSFRSILEAISNHDKVSATKMGPIVNAVSFH